MTRGLIQYQFVENHRVETIGQVPQIKSMTPKISHKSDGDQT